MFGLGFGEIILVLIVALLVLGPEKLPGIARGLGRGMREFRRAANEFHRGISSMDDFTSSGSSSRTPSPNPTAPAPGPSSPSGSQSLSLPEPIAGIVAKGAEIAADESDAKTTPENGGSSSPRSVAAERSTD